MNTNSPQLTDEQLLELFDEIASDRLKSVVRLAAKMRYNGSVKARDLYEAIAIAFMRVAMLKSQNKEKAMAPRR